MMMAVSKQHFFSATLGYGTGPLGMATGKSGDSGGTDVLEALQPDPTFNARTEILTGVLLAARARELPQRTLALDRTT